MSDFDRFPLTTARWLTNDYDEDNQAENDTTPGDVTMSAPGDMSVIGHDDAPIAKPLVPSLTTVSVDAAHYGRDLADIVLEAVIGKPTGSSADPVFSPITRESAPIEGRTLER